MSDAPLTPLAPRLPLTPAQVFELIPQKAPFLFVDSVDDVSADHVVARYTYRPEAFFYAGHFPGFPVTPGVIQLETMCQVAFALAIYLQGLDTPVDEIQKVVFMTTESTVEYARIVRPEDTVRITARKVFWRRRKLKADVELALLDGTLVSKATIGGMGVPRGS